MAYNRRRFLATGGSLAAGAALAGCSSLSSSEQRTVGDTVSRDGLEITFETYSIDPTLSVVLLDEEGAPETEDGDGPATGTYEAPEDHTYLVVVVTMENAGDEPAGLPVPGGNLLSTGELRLRVTGTERPPAPTSVDDEDAIDDGYRFDGEILPRLSLAVGSVRAELPAGESLAGWTPYVVRDSVEPSATELVYTDNPDVRYKWMLEAD